MSDPDVLELAKSGRWDEIASLLAKYRHEPIQTSKEELALVGLRNRLDSGVLYYLLNPDNDSDDVETLLDILYAGAHPSICRVKQRRCFLLLDRAEKVDLVDLAATTGKTRCLEYLLKFDAVSELTQCSCRRKRMKTLRRAAAAGFPEAVEALVRNFPD